MSYDITERILHYPRYQLLHPIDKINRYYIYHRCILCNQNIICNQYKKKTFNRIAHVECVKGLNKRGRMNDTIMIKDRQLNKKQLWKRI